MADYSKEVEDTKEYYADLLILQYHSKYRARETVKMGVDLYLGDGVVFELQDVLDIDNAEGKQLDIIGKILDCPRLIPGFETDKPFFTFEHTGDDYGFSVVGQPSQGYFKSLNFDYSSVYSLPDNDYRILLKFKAIANRARASWAGIDEIFYSVFGDSITITNNKNLSITYNILQSAVTDGLLAAIKLNYLEPPLGIGYNINYLQYNENAFTKVGNPMITSDGIVSNFSSGNYLTKTGTFDFTNNKPFRIEGHFKPTANNPDNNIFCIADDSSTVTLIGIWGNKFGCYYKNESNLPIQKLDTQEVSLNTDYYFIADYDGTTYTLKYGTDKNNINRVVVSANSSSNMTCNHINWGTNRLANGSFLNGLIDIKQFLMIIDGAIVLSGKQIY